MLEHFSWSSLNLYDTDAHQYYTRYVLGEEPKYFPKVAEAMEYGKMYELELGKQLWEKRDTQTECRSYIGEYQFLWLFDFHNAEEKKVMEVKTKSWRWSEKDIKESRQFRYYNWRCNNNWYEFILHQYNKKKDEVREEKINWKDDEFYADCLDKCKEIERYLLLNWVKMKHYEVQKNEMKCSRLWILQAGNHSVEGLRVWDNKCWRKKKWKGK